MATTGAPQRVPFENSDLQTRWYRQGGVCALCGKRLVGGNRDKGQTGAWHAHHIDGDPTNSTLGNLAIVCINVENCHLAAHHGNTAGSYVLPKSAFPYLNVVK